MVLITISAAISLLGYLAVLGYALYRGSKGSVTALWLAVCAGWSLLWAGAVALDGLDFKILNFAPGVWVMLASLGGICILGALTFSYLNRALSWAWLMAMFPLMGLALLADFIDPTPGLIDFTWLAAIRANGITAIGVAAAWCVIGLIIVILTFGETSRARLPLYANRGLWWGTMVPVLLVGEGLAMWTPEIFSVTGQSMRFLALVGLAYGITSHNLIDVRALFRSGIGNAFFIVVTAFVTILGIGAAFLILERNPGVQGQLLVGLIALVIALVYQFIRSLLDQIIKETVYKTGYDTAATAADYSKRVAQILDLKELAAAIGGTLSESVEATKSAVLLLTTQRESIRAEVVVGSGQMPTVGHRFPGDCSFFAELISNRKPILQYTVEVDEKFKSLLPIDRRWLQKLGADIYMPILDGDNLTGVIAVGPRKSRDPYRARELELLQSIADQTAVALANARLVTDLKLSNEEISALNKTLAEANQQLTEMDRVKTDFITIASHELRTPLTQVLGYADLLQMMSAAETVPGVEITPITDHVLKAGKRLNDIVSQMLDVSQMDAASIQLSLHEVNLSSILRAAVEPYEEAFIERGLFYRALDIHNLPPIQADEERLLKALKNIISNAIKFTPDGGSIEIRGKVTKARNQPESIELVFADSGVGVDKKHLELIFEKFFRVGSTALHSTSNTKFMGAGPGLGLSIAKGIIEAHSGRIWAESKGNDPQKLPGTEIHIVLPIAPAAKPESNGKAAPD